MIFRVCGAINSNWQTFTYFKLSDGQWFYIHGNESSPNDRDENHAFSVLMSAYSSRYKVKVNLTQTVHLNRCGISAAAGLWNAEGDYIALKEYSE